ncbi:MAG TPA: hypothetical protein VL689_18590 [Paraburkholderia sp.]|jgi:hypothetical protein|nr:hypothetical protein [Paraburkholderia sp.]
MRAIKAVAVIAITFGSASVLADAKCDERAKTRDDFLACSYEDVDKILSDAEKLYREIRQKTSGKNRTDLDRNFTLWKERFSSDCLIVANAFNDWGDDYSRDTDFQVAACRKRVASQELEFYKWIICPEDMETSRVPKCAAIKKALRKK